MMQYDDDVDESKVKELKEKPATTAVKPLDQAV